MVAFVLSLIISVLLSTDSAQAAARLSADDKAKLSSRLKLRATSNKALRIRKAMVGNLDNNNDNSTYEKCGQVDIHPQFVCMNDVRYCRLNSHSLGLGDYGEVMLRDVLGSKDSIERQDADNNMVMKAFTDWLDEDNVESLGTFWISEENAQSFQARAKASGGGMGVSVSAEGGVGATSSDGQSSKFGLVRLKLKDLSWVAQWLTSRSVAKEQIPPCGTKEHFEWITQAMSVKQKMTYMHKRAEKKHKGDPTWEDCEGPKKREVATLVALREKLQDAIAGHAYMKDWVTEALAYVQGDEMVIKRCFEADGKVSVESSYGGGEASMSAKDCVRQGFTFPKDATVAYRLSKLKLTERNGEFRISIEPVPDYEFTSYCGDIRD